MAAVEATERDEGRVQEAAARAADALRSENERLAQRVADLEMTVVEYRSQMSHVLNSASWRLTSPLRALATRWRIAKVRSRRAYRRLGRRRSDGTNVLTAGLFPPPVTSLPEFSPLRRGFDPQALVRPTHADGAPPAEPARPQVLVVAHVHYPELWGDIEDRLSRMPCPYDLIVTVTEGDAEAVVPDVLRRHPRARIDVVPNRGRDWAPLVALANEGALSGYEAIAKVHTKKSEHRIDGDGWRLALLDGIFESPEAIHRIVGLLREDRTVGLVVPTGHVAGTEHWGSDRAIVETLAARLPMAFDPEALTFPSGSMFWCRPWLLERFADLCLTPADFEPEAGQYDATTAHALERLVGIFAQCGAMDVVEAMDVPSRLKESRRSDKWRPTVLAFYLPQYHVTAENDAFWGEGFTDWVNVRKARPIFDGHRQPLLPSAEVGYYDLSDPEVLRRQSALARSAGVDAFVFHHYWFDGRQVLDRPMRNWLADPKSDIPMALCWANEPWTRRWDGLEKEVLIPQSFGNDWEQRYIEDVAPYLRDRRYLRFNGCPVLIIYRVDLMPERAISIRRIRSAARRVGLDDLHLLAVLPSRDFGKIPDDLDVDGMLSFPPGSGVSVEAVPPPPGWPSWTRHDQFLSYESAARSLEGQVGGATPLYRTVAPGWDNTARRGTASYAFLGANPVSFRGWCQRTLARGNKEGSDFLFINAWNEWAEGAALEPSRRFGSSNLAALTDLVGPSTGLGPG